MDTQNSISQPDPNPPLAVPEREILNSIRIDARVNVPRNIDLVSIDTVHQLSEVHSDELKWDTVMWGFIGAILGVITNWVTAEPMVISKLSLIMIGVYTLMAILAWTSAQNYKKRSENIKKSLGLSSEKKDIQS